MLVLVLTLMQGGGAAPVSLFDGVSFEGWEGETNRVWRVREGVIVGGSLEGNARNEFLATRRAYRNFRLELEYKLTGSDGFINGGVQFRSRRIEGGEMSGFQADIGAGWSGCLYDESRRRRMLVVADTNLVVRLEKAGDWNRYEIVATGPEVVLVLNGQRTVTWVERDASIAGEGLIALQIHGNSKAEISFRNIRIEELPDSPVPSEGELLRRFGEGQPVVPFRAFDAGEFHMAPGEVIAFAGQENLVREQKAGELEALLAAGFQSERPRFRSMAWEADTVYEQWRDLNFGSWIRQLETAEISLVMAQYGQMEALDGGGRLAEFEVAYHRLLDEFSVRTRRLVLISPMPFEKPLASHAPDLRERNGDVKVYVEAVRRIANQRHAVFVDLFTPLSNRPAGAPALTADGIHLNEAGLREVAGVVARQLGAATPAGVDMEALRAAIVEKNRAWFDSWRPANWSFVYGDRVSQRFGSGAGGAPSLKESFEQRRPWIAQLDQRIQALARGETVPVIRAGPVVTPAESPRGLSPEEQLKTFDVADGYRVNLFASEGNDVVNPTQIAWDERGRLYVACSPMYPQFQDSARRTDYIVVLEDSNGDGQADRSWRFAEGLSMVQGVEPGHGGVYVCDFDQLVFLGDADGDGRADSRRVLMSGFGVGDTHQLVNSISHGPDGSLWFTQGLHAMSLVETPWGIARLDRAGVWRLRPRTLRMDGFFGGGMAGANCWGVAFDDFGQVFHKSGDRPTGYWTVPGMVRGANPSGSGSRTEANQSYANSPEQYHSVGPLFDTSPKTTSIDIIGTRALPDELQGCAVIGGYFGSLVEVHRFEDAGSGFKTTQLPRLMTSSNNSFRPVDVSVGPDGAIYLADWYNPVIGHYQASYADPQRDRTHGRIWRLSSTRHAPVRQPDLASMTAAELLEQLRSPERWTRQQAKRRLFYLPTGEVLAAADRWVERLSPEGPGVERLLLEVAGVFEAHEAVRPALLDRLLSAKDARVRAYGARMIGGWSGGLENPLALLRRGVRDENPRVRLEAVVAASYVPAIESVSVATEVLSRPSDPFLDYALRQSARALQGYWQGPFSENRLELATQVQGDYLKDLAGSGPKRASPGEDLYTRTCLACHQPGGQGLSGVYPHLAGSDWVAGDTARLIKIVLHGLAGPITLNDRPFVSSAPLQMPSLGGLSDEQIADVLTYIRTELGTDAGPVSAAEVQGVRAATEGRETPWTEAEL